MGVYGPLWCKSHYSFLEGASSPEELIEEAARLGLPALALTDRDGVYGIVRAHLAAKACGVRLLVGAEVTLDGGSTLVLLCQNRDGYANLCRLLSGGRLRCEKGKSLVLWHEVAERAQGLLALWGGDRSLLVGRLEPMLAARELQDAFGDRLYALLARHRRAAEVQQEKRLRARASTLGLPLVAAVEVLYHRPERRPLQDVLSCLRHRVTLSTAGRKTKPNAEHALLPPAAMRRLYTDLPEALERTLEVAARCRFHLGELRYVYPAETQPDGSTPLEALRRLCLENAGQRNPEGVPAEVRQQLERELELIRKLDYAGYFLTMRELVVFCRERGILCQGRGSAANSAVCYYLGITAIDPVRMGLLFERFLSMERAEPPDIDLDIEHSRREEVIQHVYQRFGRSHAAMVANVIRYRPRMAVRDVGKTLGLPGASLDRLARLLPHHHGTVEAEALKMAGLDPDLPIHGHLLRLSNEILGFPRHLSIHPGGFVLGQSPVSDLVPIEPATMPGRTVIQWDKEDVEALGLFKVDLLGLGALNQLHRCFDLIRQHHGLDLSMRSIPPEDQATYEMICRGETVGVFQIESRAQMAMLPRLRPSTFYDLVIEVSIVRPGPISGGMVHPYLRRRNGQEAVLYPHPSLRPVLEKTLGVPLFQEQVMRLAMVAADYTPGEADQLRRDMAAWRQTGRIDRHRERFTSRMLGKGIAREFVDRVFEQIRGFGEYGFPESHAASFALISYATAWLRQHYLPEFLCSLLNAQPMGFYAPATLIGDAQRHGVEVRPIDLQFSDWDCTLEPPAQGASSGQLAVRMGLAYVKGLSQSDRARLEAARKPFESVDDLLRRTQLGEKPLRALAEAGAFDSFGLGRREVLWSVLGHARAEPPTLPLSEPESGPSFQALGQLQTIAWDLRRTAHSTRGHPLQTLRPELAAQGFPTARQLIHLPSGRRQRYVGIVICRQRPHTASGVTFLTLEDETGFVNLVLWKSVYEAHRLLAKTASLLGVTGRLETEDNVTHLIVEDLWTPQLSHGLDRAPSRDFH